MNLVSGSHCGYCTCCSMLLLSWFFFYANCLSLWNYCVFYCKTLKLCVSMTHVYLLDLYALAVCCQSCRKGGPALLILFYLRAPLNINVVFSLNYSLTGLPALSAFLYLRLVCFSPPHPLPPFISPLTTLGSVFPPQRLISDDIRCDGLLALILLSHDFMTLILPLEQNPLFYFAQLMAFGSI